MHNRRTSVQLPVIHQYTSESVQSQHCSNVTNMKTIENLMVIMFQPKQMLLLCSRVHVISISCQNLSPSLAWYETRLFVVVYLLACFKQSSSCSSPIGHGLDKTCSCQCYVSGYQGYARRLSLNQYAWLVPPSIHVTSTLMFCWTKAHILIESRILRDMCNFSVITASSDSCVSGRLGHLANLTVSVCSQFYPLILNNINVCD